MIYHVYDEHGRFMFPIDKAEWDRNYNPELREHCERLFREQMLQDLEEVNL